MALWLAAQAPAAAAPVGDVDVHALRLGPGCIGERWVNINLAGAPFDPVSARHGGYFVQGINIGALADETRLLFPEPEHFSDPGLAPRFLAAVAADAAHAGEGAMKREVLDERLPVLVGAI
ncbi:MAG TPA: hypothetical protein VGO62_01175, partial [Myxococcota bacterium]